MRIKTTSKVMAELDVLRRVFNFDNNAQLLRLAVNYGLKKGVELDLELKEDGFAIDTHTLFGEEEQMYKYILEKQHVEIDYKIILINYIHSGIMLLINDLRYAKNDINVLLEKEILCI